MDADDPLLERLVSALDLSDPTPAWHQVAAVIRWEVAQGRLSIGAVLPPIRTVARAVGLHYHTVRRAWAALAEEGVLAQRQGRGARIVRAATVSGGWTPAGPSAEAGDLPRAWVVAHSLELAARLAARLVARWAVTAVPYPAAAAAPPPGPILTLDDGVQQRWPGREGDIQRIDPVLDPATVTVVRRNARLLGTSEVTIVALETDPATAVADLLRQLPRLGLTARRTDPASARPAGEHLRVFFPAAWQQLDWEGRMHPGAMAAEFEWAPGPLARVATRLDWQGRSD